MVVFNSKISCLVVGSLVAGSASFGCSSETSSGPRALAGHRDDSSADASSSSPGSTSTPESTPGPTSASDPDSTVGSDSQLGSDAAPDTGTDTLPPSPTCDEPAPWPVPSTGSVVGNGTAESCTEDALRAAVAGGGHVTFACGDAPVTIDVHAEIESGPQTVLDGESGTITLDGVGASRIVAAPNGGSLSVRHLRFVNGTAPVSEDADGIGGAVAGGWRSRVEVRDCTFEDNAAGRGGGAVSVWTGSELTIVGSRFYRNRSFYGGAVYSLLSPLHIVNSTFEDNETIDNGWGEGGAIGTDGASEFPDDAAGGTIEICGAAIRNNRGLSSGGGVYIWAYPPDRVIVDRVTVEGNAVGGGGLGGAMRVSNGEIVIRASSFLANTSDNHGGALYLDCAPTCDITNSTFHGNDAGTYGGAISCGGGARLNNVTFATNTAGGHGGALFGGGFEIRNTVFVDNTAQNPWNQANNCGETWTGDHVLQWLGSASDGGGDLCVADVLVVDPVFAAVPGDYGGPTPTLLPDASSPVLQAGAACEPVDQRGDPRDQAICDLGAVELP